MQIQQNIVLPFLNFHTMQSNTILFPNTTVTSTTPTLPSSSDEPLLERNVKVQRQTKAQKSPTTKVTNKSTKSKSTNQERSCPVCTLPLAEGETPEQHYEYELNRLEELSNGVVEYNIQSIVSPIG